MGWLMIRVNCPTCTKDSEYLWDREREDLSLTPCPKCASVGVVRKFDGAHIMNRALPDGTSRGADFEKMKRVMDLKCEVGDYEPGSTERIECEREITSLGGSAAEPNL